MTSKEKLDSVLSYLIFPKCISKEERQEIYKKLNVVEKDLSILQEIRNEYKVFKDGDDYFLRGGKNLYLITKKQYDNWVRWLGNEK